MAYVGTPIDTTNQFQSLQGKRFSGDASTTAFTLDIAPSSVFDIEVFVENVRQDPNSAYTLSGTTLTFTGAPPSGTNNIYVVHQAKAVGTIDLPEGALVDLNGGSDKLVLDADGDTTISADTDDQIDFKTGGSDRLTINSSGNVGIGTTSPTAQLEVVDDTADGITARFTNSNANNDGAYIDLYKDSSSPADNDVTGTIRFRSNDSGGTPHNIGVIQVVTTDVTDGTEDGYMAFSTRASGSTGERMRIDSSGYFIYGGTDNLVYPDSSGSGGVVFRENYIQSARQGGNLYTNRIGSDGDIIIFHQDGNEEGNIRVSGTTISYNGFTGTHWTRLSDNSKPTILKGTILESLDAMMDWYQVQFNVTKTDDEGNETTTTKKESYALSDGESVGDTITYTYEGTDYQATIIKEGDVKHSKCKVSDTSESKAVYGVFMDWDDEDDTVNDMHVAQTGTFVVRLNSSVTTLNKGDLIQSNGDGTGKVQTDDLLRASTVAKVLSTTKIETYDDGSYIVPCSLHC